MNFPLLSGNFDGLINFMITHDMKNYIVLETSGNHVDDGVIQRDPWLIFDYDDEDSRWASSGSGGSQ